jgi:hypothetical protein
MPGRLIRMTHRGAFESSARLAMRFDETNGVPYRHNLLGRIVGNFTAEFFFKSHHQLDSVEAVRAQIVDETGIFSYLCFVDAKMLDNDLLNPLGDIAHTLISSFDRADWLRSVWSEARFVDLPLDVRRRGPKKVG